ncbi:MAG: DNA-binding protein [Alphaproteobacteria bacterium]|nr:MAG: DNA-binding protein [Alphaproteobacteria bacterium]
MSTEIATIEKVQAAVDQLHRAGHKATADAVIDVIGGGSKPTVLKHMRTLREQPKTEEVALPPSILDLVRPAAAQIYAEGSRAEAARNRDQVERLHRLLGDLEAQVEELASANSSQEARIAELAARESEAATALAEANRTIARQREDMSALQTELAGRNGEAASQLATLIGEFETKLAALNPPSTSHKRPGGRASK